MIAVFGSLDREGTRCANSLCARAARWPSRAASPCRVTTSVATAGPGSQRHPAPCPSCALVRVLAFRDADGVDICAGCAGEEPTFTCRRCGREDNSYGACCGPCTLNERLTAILTDPDTGQIHARLVPLFDALIKADCPQSAMYWLQRPPGDGPRLLGAMARGEVEISHETFEGLAQSRGYLYLRDLLAAVGVLAPYEARIERTIAWLDELLAALPPEHANLVERYARWKVLRHLRNRAARGELTKGVIQAARTQIRGTIALLTWLAERDVTITTATQSRPRALHRHRATKDDAQWDLSIHRLGTRDGSQPGVGSHARPVWFSFGDDVRRRSVAPRRTPPPRHHDPLQPPASVVSSCSCSHSP